jgi:FkbM family methyltransferase
MGIFSIYAAIKHPNATIYAFEPGPNVFAALKENVKDYPNIKVFNSGLGDVVEKRDLVISPTETGISHFDGPVLNGEHTVPAELTTIDNFNMRVDFIKMDTEGYEANILRGATETIKKYRPIIAMSAYHHPGDKTELPRILKEICPDYICELHHDDEEDFICQVARQ